MKLTHYANGVALVSAVQLRDETGGYSARAVLGSPDIIEVTVEDPTGTLDFTGHKPWYMTEDDCAAGNRTVWRGYVGAQKILRGPALRTTVARKWALSLVEENAILGRRVLGWASAGVRDLSASRPAETVSARIAWLQTTLGFSGVIADHGLIATSSVLMDATDYKDRMTTDVLQDCALASGYNYFVRYRESSNDVELAFFDALVSALDLSTFRVSNVLADVDYAVTWQGSPLATLDRNPERIASGIVVPYNGGSVYRTLGSTATAFASVDLVAATGNINTAAAATALADRLLLQHDDQEERITSCVVQVPAANLNDVKHGQRIAVKFSHMPGWTSFRNARVVSKSFARPEGLTQDLYDVTLELEPVIATTATTARTMRPNDNGSQGGGLFRLNWDNDGDNPQAGDTSYPLSGLIAYTGPLAERTGLTMLGDGYVTITLAFSVTQVVDGANTFTATIRQNGTVIATSSQVSTGGLRAQSWDIVNTPLVATSVIVQNGDVIEGYVHRSSEANPSTFVIPAGTGNGSHWLLVSGDVAAR